ncbi:hypothetical protein ACIQKE_02525 [Streptomyces griseoviridis]
MVVPGDSRRLSVRMGGRLVWDGRRALDGRVAAVDGRVTVSQLPPGTHHFTARQTD